MNPNANPEKAMLLAQTLLRVMLANGADRVLHRDAVPQYATHHLHTATHCILLSICPLSDESAH